MRVYFPPVEMLDSEEEVDCLAIRLISQLLGNHAQLRDLLTGLRYLGYNLIYFYPGLEAMDDVVNDFLLLQNLALVILHLDVNERAQVIECVQLVTLGFAELVEGLLHEGLPDQSLREEPPLLGLGFECLLQVYVAICDEDADYALRELVPWFEGLEGLVYVHVKHPLDDTPDGALELLPVLIVHGDASGKNDLSVLCFDLAE
jgi:hypothetical protein